MHLQPLYNTKGSDDAPGAMIKIFRINLLLLLLYLWPIVSFAGNGVVGVYGIPGAVGDKGANLASQLKEAQVSAVFVQPDSDIIRFYSEHKFKVYLTLNVFGGRQPWKDFPDSVPVTSDGNKLSGKYGGVCPTHFEWRESRLMLLERWLNDYAGVNGFSGVWFDFIRYPGSWEHENPSIPDSCYCQRCLTLFQAERGVKLPEGEDTAETARWIKQYAAAQWLEWKKEQITSFARDARALVNRFSKERKLQLGAFLVPWRKSENNGALSFHLAQDAELLAPYIDLFSPMVYHRMVGESVSWIKEITDYFADLSGVEIWPIVQAEDVDVEEFGKIVQAVSDSDAGGMLIYKFSKLEEGHWPLLAQLEVKENVLPNPRLKIDGTSGANKQYYQPEAGLPLHWFIPPVDKVRDSRFWIEEQGENDRNAIGLTAGNDRQAIWSTDLPNCQPGTSYLFSAEFLRQNRRDGLAYPEISLWGQEYLLNTHRMAGKFQRLKTIVTCPESRNEDESIFQFRNMYPGNSFWMRSPVLVAREQTERISQVNPSQPATNFFPIGTYGANSKNLGVLKELGLNTAVVTLNRGNIEKCLSLGMHCTLSVPRDPARLILALDQFDSLLRQGRFAYYVNDEPGIHSFSEGKAEDIQRIIKERFPEAVKGMAIVRPQIIPFYEKGADYFMLDQYPVPSMPMTWLSESMDEAALHVGRGRLQSVIQAFGATKYAEGGWPRLPTFEEMNCLAFLSIIHGSRGIYFYTFPSISSTMQGKEDFTRLIRRLNSMRSWLQVPNDEEKVSVEMTSTYKFDPRGNPAVHCVQKVQYNTGMLICANTLNTHTEAEISLSGKRLSEWQDYFGSVVSPVVDGTILARFAPYEVKVLIESK